MNSSTNMRDSRHGAHLRFGALVAWLLPGLALAVDRFPRPEFESGYELPTPTYVLPRANIHDWLDVAVLLACLVLGAYLVLKQRRRRTIALLSVFALLYFGFWRRGCICPVGATQNLVLAVCDSTYAVPATVVLMFTLPLLFAFLFGRVFCSAICPLGAIQDIVILKPVALPGWLNTSLGMLRHVVLGLGVLLAATGTGFLICRLDPFVGLFRFGGHFHMIAAGVVLLVLGTAIARPYCRFFCPYGILLGWASLVSWRPVRITPDECVQCRLCEDTCPFGAIRRPTPSQVPETHARGVRRLAFILVLLPLVVLAGALGGRHVSPVLARMNFTVSLADRIRIEDNAGGALTMTLESETFRAMGQSVAELEAEAAAVVGRFRLGGTLLGGYLAFVFGAKLLALSVRRTREDYDPDPAICLACGRCFEYCPREHVKRKGDHALET